MPARFEPDAPRYNHGIGGCKRHVVPAARAVALASMCFLLFGTIYGVFYGYFSSKESFFAEIVFFLVGFACISFLFLAVFTKYGRFVVPYLIYQVFHAVKVISLPIIQYIVQKKNHYYSSSSFIHESILLAVAGAIVKLTIIVYFCKIIINYYVFRKRETAFKTCAIRDVIEGSNNFDTPRNRAHTLILSQPHYGARDEPLNQPQGSPSHPHNAPSAPLLADPPSYERALTPPYLGPPSPCPSVHSPTRCPNLPCQHQACPNCSAGCSEHMFEPPPPYQE